MHTRIRSLNTLTRLSARARVLDRLHGIVSGHDTLVLDYTCPSTHTLNKTRTNILDQSKCIIFGHDILILEDQLQVLFFLTFVDLKEEGLFKKWIVVALLCEQRMPSVRMALDCRCRQRKGSVRLGLVDENCQSDFWLMVALLSAQMMLLVNLPQDTLAVARSIPSNLGFV